LGGIPLANWVFFQAVLGVFPYRIAAADPQQYPQALFLPGRAPMPLALA
jgi:hypothetical protein